MFISWKKTCSPSPCSPNFAKSTCTNNSDMQNNCYLASTATVIHRVIRFLYAPHLQSPHLLAFRNMGCQRRPNDTQRPPHSLNGSCLATHKRTCKLRPWYTWLSFQSLGQFFEELKRWYTYNTFIFINIYVYIIIFMIGYVYIICTYINVRICNIIYRYIVSWIHTVDGRNPAPLCMRRAFPAPLECLHCSYSSPGKVSSSEWLKSCTTLDVNPTLKLWGLQGEASKMLSCMTWQAVQDFSHQPYNTKNVDKPPILEVSRVIQVYSAILIFPSRPVRTGSFAISFYGFNLQDLREERGPPSLTSPKRMALPIVCLYLTVVICWSPKDWLRLKKNPNCF